MARYRKKPVSVPLYVRWIHELWWRVFRWPEDQRIAGRVAISEHYARRFTSETAVS